MERKRACKQKTKKTFRARLDAQLYTPWKCDEQMNAN